MVNVLWLTFIVKWENVCHNAICHESYVQQLYNISWNPITLFLSHFHPDLSTRQKFNDNNKYTHCLRQIITKCIPLKSFESKY